jgi:hypothetical protein
MSTNRPGENSQQNSVAASRVITCWTRAFNLERDRGANGGLTKTTPKKQRTAADRNTLYRIVFAWIVDNVIIHERARGLF